MYTCDVKEACDGRVGHFVLNLFGTDAARPADVGVCVRCLRAEWRKGGGLHAAADRLLARYADRQMAAEEQANLERDRLEEEGRTLHEEFDDTEAAAAWAEQRQDGET